MGFFFDEKGKGSAFFNNRLEEDGEVTDQIVDSFSSQLSSDTASPFLDLDNAGEVKFRALEQTSGTWLTERGGVIELRINLNTGDINDAGTGEFLGRVIGNNIFDSAGIFRGRILDGTSPQQVAIAATQLFTE